MFFFHFVNLLLLHLSWSCQLFDNSQTLSSSTISLFFNGIFVWEGCWSVFLSEGAGTSSKHPVGVAVGLGVGARQWGLGVGARQWGLGVGARQ